MITLAQQLDEDRKVARKERNQFVLTTLSTVIGEAETKHRSGDKSFADLDKTIVKIIKATIVSCQEMYKLKNDEKSLLEIEILEKYLPKNMSVEQINDILNNNQFTELKDVMQFFKNLNTPVDMKEVREIFMSNSK